MRERDVNRQLFHAGHYNVIAGRIKRSLEPYVVAEVEISNGSLLHARVALVELALEFAYRLQADNELFDPIRFLQACSPDPVALPIHELWDLDNYKHMMEMELAK